MKLVTKNYKTFQVDTISFDDYHQANRCLNGDEVEWDGTKCQLLKRADHGTLVGILELNSKYLYGHTSRGTKIYLFHPLNPAYPPFRVGCSERDTSRNQLALVKFETWTETIPRANLIRLLGPIGNLDAEKKALQWLYGRPDLQKITFDLEPGIQSRRLVKENTINIDPESCKDIDDVITLIPNEDGWKLLITIADVAEAIQPGSPGDLLAEQKGQTLYQTGVAALPMLPPHVSEDALSLIPGQQRQGIALNCLWSNNHLTVNGFEEVTVENTASYTYETVYSSTFPVNILQEIASFLKGSQTNDSHEWIEELMLLYNKEGAKLLLEAKAGLLRTHKEAKKEVLERMEQIHPDLRSLAFESAKYELTGENKVHATLGNIPYTHLSSPLRRYADLVNQRVLKALLRKETVPTVSPSLPSSLNEIQKKMKHHDRELFFLQQIVEQTTGILEGLVVESTGSKTKLYIPGWKRTVKVVCEPMEPGTKVTVEYFADLRKVSWKERIVFRLKN
jgi:exoribonuclease R